ncbi:MarR family winged helix-turn-helix transcriptional regulator [Arcobacter sp. s6]|uniref:MarR family winged helix-turn-helix transcriptional regulator n=1 Tax=Arcobacter sp. s6 TaxID=3230363 RepID=UPI0034A03665
MKKKILDAFYAFEKKEKQEGKKGTAGITIPMAIINNMIHSRGKYIYEEQGLTQAEIDMLISLHVHNDGITAAEISDRMVFSSGGISKVVKKLELKKLISRKDSSEDKRSSLIYLEDKGRELALKCMPQFGKNDQYFYDVLNETEKEILEKAFKKILYSIAEKEIKLQ